MTDEDEKDVNILQYTCKGVHDTVQYHSDRKMAVLKYMIGDHVSVIVSILHWDIFNRTNIPVVPSHVYVCITNYVL